MRIYKIYALREPDSMKIRYIGVTCSDSSKRYSQHLADVRRNPQTHKNKWIASLLNCGEKPVMSIIEECTEENWEEREIYYIKRLRDEGCNLTNYHEGGKGVCLSKRENNSKKRKVYKYDLEGNFLEEFPSAVAAATSTNVNTSSINRVLVGGKGTCGNFQWSYIKTENFGKWEDPRNVKIRCYKMEPVFYKDFKTLEEIVKDTGLSIDAVYDSINKKRPAKGYFLEKITT